MIYLYAITDQPDLPLSTLTGLEQAAKLEIYPYWDIAAVISHTTTAALSPVETNLWQHEGVLEVLMTDRTILPVRFGTVLTDEVALKDILETHYADFAAGLKRVCGRVELSLRVLWEEEGSRGAATGELHSHKVVRARGGKREEPPWPSLHSHLPSQSWREWGAEASGRDYLLSRLEAERQRQSLRREAERLAAELHAPLASLSVENRRQILLTPRMLLKAAYLVEREQLAAFRQEIGNLSVAHPTFRFLCTGPWPPYNFVTV